MNPIFSCQFTCGFLVPVILKIQLQIQLFNYFNRASIRTWFLTRRMAIIILWNDTDSKAAIPYYFLRILLKLWGTSIHSTCKNNGLYIFGILIRKWLFTPSSNPYLNSSEGIFLLRDIKLYYTCNWCSIKKSGTNYTFCCPSPSALYGLYQA